MIFLKEEPIWKHFGLVGLSYLNVGFEGQINTSLTKVLLLNGGGIVGSHDPAVVYRDVGQVRNCQDCVSVEIVVVA